VAGPLVSIPQGITYPGPSKVWSSPLRFQSSGSLMQFEQPNALSAECQIGYIEFASPKRSFRGQLVDGRRPKQVEMDYSIENLESAMTAAVPFSCLCYLLLILRYLRRGSPVHNPSRSIYPKETAMTRPVPLLRVCPGPTFRSSFLAHPQVPKHNSNNASYRPAPSRCASRFRNRPGCAE
jgi:hypothetical protein